MFFYFLYARVPVNHGAGTVLGLLHNLRVVGPVPLGNSHERSP